MPRHDWRDDDDFMTRDRRMEDYRDSDRSDRERGYDDGRRGGSLDHRGRIGGWGSLLEDDSSGGRNRTDSRSQDRRHRDYGPDDDRSGLPRDETERLIASNKVEGTPVYDRNGDRLGSIQNFMVDKFRGRVVYAVLKHSSGFLGLDERYYPVDWDQLHYDTRLGGYHIDLIEDELKGRGSWDRSERWQGRGSRSDHEGMRSGRDYERRMRDPW